MNTQKYILTEPQSQIFESTERFRVVVAGRRFGKTYELAIEIIKEALISSERIILYLAPTYPMAKKTMFYYLQRLLPKEIVKDINRSDMTITLKNQSIIYIAGSKNLDAHRGYPYINHAFIDEAALQDREVWEAVIRPAVANVQGRVTFAGTPYGKSNWFYDLSQQNYVQVFHFTTLQGGFVPEEEIEQAKKEMDERTFRQEFLATFETIEGLVYYNYGEHNHTGREYNPKLPTILCWDFNVDPTSCIIVQKDGNKYYAVKEFVINNANTEIVSIEVARFLKDHQNTLQICGDATGHARKSSSSVVDYEIIKRELKHIYGFDPYFRTRITKLQKDRVMATCSLFRSYAGEVRLFVNPKTCPRLHKDLLTVQWKEGEATIDKKPHISDPSDALSYLAHNYEPIQEVSQGRFL